MTNRPPCTWLVGLFLFIPSLLQAQAPEPTAPATNVSKTIIACDEVQTNWTSGNGAARLMVMKAGSPVDVLPQDNTSYTPNSTFGQGSNLGNGNYAVYQGTGSSAIINGLQGGITYHFAIFEFNTQGSAVNYLTHTYPSLNIPVPDPITLNPVVDSITCFEANDGSIQLNIQGGTQPFSITWSHGGSGNGVSSLGPGSYTVSVTDDVGCTGQQTFTLTEPDALNITANTVDVECYASSTGAIDISIVGGSTPYEFSWSNGASTEDLDQIPAGSYQLTITDGNGCTTHEAFEVTQPRPITISPTITHVNCNGDGNGSINLNVSGGTAGYDFEWDNGATAPNRSNLDGGNYSVTVTDAAGCQESQTFEIEEPEPITISFDITPVSCEGEQDGILTANIQGGQSPYQYQWSSGENESSLTGLSTGAYTLTVTDANACTSDEQAVMDVDPDNRGCLKYLVIYDAYTPNGDGKNDTWVIEGLEEFPNNELEIYNRWGKAVYRASNYQNDWKGETSNGDLLPAGSYYYILYIHLSNEVVEKAGSVTFLR